MGETKVVNDMSGWTDANLVAAGGYGDLAPPVLTGQFTPSPLPRRQEQRQQQQQQRQREDAWDDDGEGYFNGGAILREIPVRGRADNVEQVAFRPQDDGGGGSRGGGAGDGKEVRRENLLYLLPSETSDPNSRDLPPCGNFRSETKKA